MNKNDSKYTVNGDTHITFTCAERRRIEDVARVRGTTHGLERAIVRRTMFQQSNAAMVVGECAKYALETARAIDLAESHDCEFRWDHDDDADYSFVETWPAADQVRWNRDDHEAEYCQLVNPDGHVLASLSGIIDATADYRRVVEGELASEAADVIRAMCECPFAT